MKPKINPAVYELLELAKIRSPFTSHLVNKTRQKIVDRLLAMRKIDSETANYLLS
ncbi:MAG: hypothetical protein ACD_83C00022G0001 [uncultured bacterium]|nr:MAG: hypothetical protein ACD_83C00022G0001 [uncultured bacterium]